MTEKRFKLELRRVGNRIQAIRKAKGLKQLDLELRTSIDRADISKIEHGNKNLEYLTILRIAEALEVHPSELIIPKSEYDL